MLKDEIMSYKVTVLGAGLAGCEAALWLAGKGVQVTLYEQKPTHFSPAHKSAGFAELICSNSLKAERLDSASGLLKEEMRRMGSQLLNAAQGGWAVVFLPRTRRGKNDRIPLLVGKFRQQNVF